MMRSAIMILLTVMLLAACSQQQGTVTDITPNDLNDLMTDEDVFLIDVHIPEQRHIKGTDVMIPYNEIEANLDELPDDKTIVVYCRSGSMSRQASEQLAGLGYDVYNLVGGVNAWKASGYPMEVEG